MENITLVALDVDGTLIKHNTWYEINTALGITPEEDTQMYDDYSVGELTYADWIDKLEDLYRIRGQATKDTVTKVLQDKVSVPAEARELVDYLKSKGYQLVVLSGSFDVVAKHIATELGILYYKGNARFTFDNDGAFVGLENDGEEKYAKVEHLTSFTNKLGVTLEECACVGDGGNDMEIFKVTQHGITFSSSSDEIKQVAWKVVDSLGDIKDVL